MAEQKKSLLVTVEILLETFATTGLEEKPYAAFVQFCKSEVGEIAGNNIDTFQGLTISGKGDKAKGKFARGNVEFAQRHNVATAVLAGCTALKKIEDSTNMLIGKLDCRELCEHWRDRWEAKQEAKRREAEIESTAKLEASKVESK